MIKTILWKSLEKTEKKSLLKRASPTTHIPQFEMKVRDILSTVKEMGDRSLYDYTEKLDGVRLKALKVTDVEFENALKTITAPVCDALEFAIHNIEAYHKPQVPKAYSVETRPGVICSKQPQPLQRVGLYVPGGTAPLVSTVMMLAVPARLAACPLRILCTPPSLDGSINAALLTAAHLCGINTVYKIGGVQAISAMAYGTETLPKVDKIFGPGNAWVTQAKTLVSQDPEGSAIDLPAGPSELMVVADEHANPQYIAADLLSQAEHGADSQVFLVCTSEALAKAVASAITQQTMILPRAAIVEKSLHHSAIILVDSLIEAIQINNSYAPEHLILQTQDPEALLPLIQSAGSVFVGAFSPETVGDYVTGANHVLPTYGYAKSYSGLSVTDFMKFITVQTVSLQGFRNIAKQAALLAELEGLQAHKNAVSLRLKDLD